MMTVVTDVFHLHAAKNVVGIMNLITAQQNRITRVVNTEKQTKQ